jgi:hypothetical protein
MDHGHQVRGNTPRLISVGASARPRSRNRGWPIMRYLSVARGCSTTDRHSRMASGVALCSMPAIAFSYRCGAIHRRTRLCPLVLIEQALALCTVRAPPAARNFATIDCRPLTRHQPYRPRQAHQLSSGLGHGWAHLNWSTRDDWRDWARLSEGCYLLRSAVTDWGGEKLWLGLHATDRG